MKILLDCVVTSKDPAKCSSNIQFLTFVKRTLKARPDVFFYWLIPDWVTEEDFLKTYPQDERVAYTRVPQHKDRTKEYFTISKELDNAVAFNGVAWDFDVLVTMRTGLVPLFRLIMNSPRTPKLAWLKEVWLIEEMPLMDFKKTVLTINRDPQDLFTISGYLAADKVFILSYHEKPAIIKRAKDFLTPSNVMKLNAIQPVITSQSSEFRLKKPEDYPRPDDDKPFCIAFSGRIAASSSIDQINDVMVNSFVMKGSKVRLLVTTVSAGIKKFDTSVVEVKYASREEFWDLSRHDMHVIINMATEGGFLLSLIEPMMLGVPAIVLREPWSEALLGDDFPFFVDNEVQAYAIAGMFYDDYPTMYAKWSEWFEKSFRPMMEARFKTDLMYDRLDLAIDQFIAKRHQFRETNPGKEDNKFIADVLAEIGDAQEFVVGDVVEGMVAGGKANKKMLEKLELDDRDKRGLAFCTSWNDYRVIFQEFHGWEDASVKVGHLRRKKG